jgi:hypothetical protein
MKTPENSFLDVGFAIFEFYEKYVIATVREGVVLGKQEMAKFHDVFMDYYGENHFGYISNRKNDYTINPLYYKEIEKYNLNIVGVATLCYSKESYDMAVFAEQFFNWPHAAFYKLEDCISFISQRYDEEKNAGL